MKIAAYQAPLETTFSTNKIIRLIREQIDRCESLGVEILCCPEAVLGGLADYSERVLDFAIDVEAGQLQTLLTPLASEKVTTILGFTETNKNGLLYNSAAIFHRGSVIGTYRKLYPAINKSVYTAGEELPVFTIDDLTFGIIICNDSNYTELPKSLAAQRASAIFIPTNNGLPPAKTGPDLVARTRNVDIARATENDVFIVRADVVGRTEEFIAYGTSEIVSPDGIVLASTGQFDTDLVVAEISAAGRPRTAGSGGLL